MVSRKSPQSLASCVTSGRDSEVNCELRVIKHSNGYLYLCLFAKSKIESGQELKLKQDKVCYTSGLCILAHISKWQNLTKWINPNCMCHCGLVGINRVPTAQRKQGKLWKVIPDRENTGNLKILEKQGKHREFENLRMILKSNSHLHSSAAGRDS